MVKNLWKKLTNSSDGKGQVFYGLHFYPGVARYQEPGTEAFTVYLNEDTLRKMDPSFAGRPVFVLHVDSVEQDVDELRKEADGWAVESFYNPADGKHWVKFLMCSDRGLEAVQRGLRLSNCYVAKNYGPGGVWNGVAYDKEIIDGEYEHLAIVPNPRYDESVIMTPEEFKAYNDEKQAELRKLANANKANPPAKGDVPMKFDFFKRSKVENTADLEVMSVLLPKSKREVSLAKLINEADEVEMEKGKKKEGMEKAGEKMNAEPAEGVRAEKMKDAEQEGEGQKLMEAADPVKHYVDMDGKKMPVGELMDCYRDACAALHSMKQGDDSSMEDSVDERDDGKKPFDPAAQNEDEDQDLEHAHTPVPMSEDDKMGEKQALKLEKHEEGVVKDSRKKNAGSPPPQYKNAAAQALANAKAKSEFQSQGQADRMIFNSDRVSRGKKLFGSAG